MQRNDVLAEMVFNGIICLGLEKCLYIYYKDTQFIYKYQSLMLCLKCSLNYKNKKPTKIYNYTFIMMIINKDATASPSEVEYLAITDGDLLKWEVVKTKTEKDKDDRSENRV